MRAPLPDFMPADVSTIIRKNVTALLSDPEITVEVEYRRIDSTSYSTATGTQARVVGKSSFSAVMEEVKQRQGSVARVSDHRFLFLKSLMPDDPRKGDEIRCDKDVWIVISWDSDLEKLMWLVVARRANA